MAEENQTPTGNSEVPAAGSKTIVDPVANVGNKGGPILVLRSESADAKIVDPAASSAIPKAANRSNLNALKGAAPIGEQRLSEGLPWASVTGEGTTIRQAEVAVEHAAQVTAQQTPKTISENGQAKFKAPRSFRAP